MTQHVNVAVFRAIETRRAVLRATNTGLTCAIDPTGRITSRIERDVAGSLPVTVQISETTPVLLGAGVWFGWLIGAGGLGWIVLALRRSRSA
jgi:apolipoprotein N-acyltransferase